MIAGFDERCWTSRGVAAPWNVPALWLRPSQLAGSAGSPVLTWPDASVMENHAEISSGSAVVVAEGIGSVAKCALFDPAASMDLRRVITATESAAVYVVARSNITPLPAQRSFFPLGQQSLNQYGLVVRRLQLRSGTAWVSMSADVSDTRNLWQLYSARIAGGERSLRLNGDILDRVASPGSRKLTVNRIGLGSFVGDTPAHWFAAEIRVYVGWVSDSQDEDISDELRATYGLP